MLFVVVIPLVFMLVGGFITVPFFVEFFRWFRCTDVADGTVIGYSDSEGYVFGDNEDIDCMVAPLYEYVYDDIIYQNHPKSYSLDLPRKGVKAKLRINPNNPDDVYFQGELMSNLTLLMFGGIFFFAGFFTGVAILFSGGVL